MLRSMNSSFLRVLYPEHSTRKCFSSSTAGFSQTLQSRFSGETLGFLYLPSSVMGSDNQVQSVSISCREVH